MNVYAAHGWTVTLDPGGYVVRDRHGKALEVYADRCEAFRRLTALSSGTAKPDRLFEPAPAVIAGQLGLGIS